MMCQYVPLKKCFPLTQRAFCLGKSRSLANQTNAATEKRTTRQREWKLDKWEREDDKSESWLHRGQTISHCLHQQKNFFVTDLSHLGSPKPCGRKEGPLSATFFNFINNELCEACRGSLTLPRSNKAAGQCSPTPARKRERSVSKQRQKIQVCSHTHSSRLTLNISSEPLD